MLALFVYAAVTIGVRRTVVYKKVIGAVDFCRTTGGLGDYMQRLVQVDTAVLFLSLANGADRVQSTRFQSRHERSPGNLRASCEVWSVELRRRTSTQSHRAFAPCFQWTISSLPAGRNCAFKRKGERAWRASDSIATHSTGTRFFLERINCVRRFCILSSIVRVTRRRDSPAGRQPPRIRQLDFVASLERRRACRELTFQTFPVPAALSFRQTSCSRESPRTPRFRPAFPPICRESC